MLGTRIVTGLALGAVVTAVILYLPTAYAAGSLAVLWLAGAWEWAGLARLARAERGAYAAATVLLMLAVAWRLDSLAVIDAILALALAGWALALAGILTYPRPIADAWIALAGPVALLPSWLALEYLHAAHPRGPALVLLALALVWAADVGAYAIGRLFGRVKLAPKVSPGKTWEGVLGGVALALAAAWAGSAWLDLAAGPLLAIAAVTALVSVVGDLTVSMLKRRVGLKDTGSLLPGHGGVMDRIDGLVAAVPAYALGLRASGVL